ncbi:MAG: hypothetical protein A2790_19810 [Phenylobacterium sp. RIFCSPHIGHO2_01_FULL_69_31]|uniref:DUF4870 family protein n=1 Tax=Phenylobacterium sp. RIFCSPHIGHO2_01_FULL_69_31 TaxID=1801944 RepID=UPI0008AD64C0|nr:hypothetical protein [Phenylobacterium sp. RIFCSPHIGHO2_01_FULL_69_31]OHB26217.1 MAG: hypothetical protein A2790_19810 [Phenylobacterium sp. RIFCSPHIGHO2_01_FULL_69_31]
MTDDVGYAANEDKTMPAVCYALYLLAFVTGITAIIGLIIAYSQRAAAGPTMESHYTFLIRTFWIGLGLMIAGGVLFGVGALLAVILIGFPIMGVAWLIMGGAAIWYGVRCVVGLVFLSRGEAYPRPYAVIA